MRDFRYYERRNVLYSLGSEEIIKDMINKNRHVQKIRNQLAKKKFTDIKS